MCFCVVTVFGNVWAEGAAFGPAYVPFTIPRGFAEIGYGDTIERAEASARAKLAA